MKQKFIIALTVLLAISTVSRGQNKNLNSIEDKSDRQFFIENKGQWHSDVLYLYRMGGLDAWITKKGVTYDFYKVRKKENFYKKDLLSVNDETARKHPEQERYGHVVRVSHAGTDENPVREGRKQQQAYYNYFIGADQSKWASHVGLYKEVWVKNIYNGIDQKWYFDKGSLRYDYVVQPNADYKQIKLSIEGAENIQIKGKDLIFTTRFGEVKQSELFVYQNINGNKVKTEAQWKKQDNAFTFELQNYNPQYELVIDPIVWSTFIGAPDSDGADAITIDAVNNVYITGSTGSSSFPTTVGAYDNTMNGGMDVFVTKLNSSGIALIYSTFIGGTYALPYACSDYAYSIALDNSGSAYITGYTSCPDYPVTAGAFDAVYNGGYSDCFVTKINASGTTLEYSTYFGGRSHDEAFSIAVDALGCAYITGQTYSTNTGIPISTRFPITAGTYDNTYNYRDGFVAKLNATGTGLFYSTYFGGTDLEYGKCIKLDAFNNAYIGGWTMSGNFPVTVGCYDNTLDAVTGVDGFVLVLNDLGNALVYSTYLGGNGDDRVAGLALNTTGNVHVTGWTNSADFPVTAGAFSTAYNGGLLDGFVTQFDVSGSSVLYSTYIGGSHTDHYAGIETDVSGNVYVAGISSSPDYPTTPGSHDPTYTGGTDIEVVVSKLNSTLSTLLYSTYIGGTLDDFFAMDYTTSVMRVDNLENVYIAGITWSTDYPVTAGAFDTSHNSPGFISDVFVTKLCTHPSCILPVEELNLKARYYSYHNAVQLDWQSKLEQVSLYVVEKYQDKAWTELTQTSQFTYQDKDVLPNTTVLYKIKALDKDGKVVYSNTETVTIPAQDKTFIIYPNPAQNYFYLENYTQNAEFHIIDITGKILQSHTLPTGKHRIDIELPKGLYFVKSQNTTQKLLIQ